MDKKRSRSWEKGRKMIMIKERTKKELELIGHMRETYDGVIWRLIQDYKKHNKDR